MFYKCIFRIGWLYVFLLAMSCASDFSSLKAGSHGCNKYNHYSLDQLQQNKTQFLRNLSIILELTKRAVNNNSHQENSGLRSILCLMKDATSYVETNGHKVNAFYNWHKNLVVPLLKIVNDFLASENEFGTEDLQCLNDEVQQLIVVFNAVLLLRSKPSSQKRIQQCEQIFYECKKTLKIIFEIEKTCKFLKKIEQNLKDNCNKRNNNLNKRDYFLKTIKSQLLQFRQQQLSRSQLQSLHEINLLIQQYEQEIEEDTRAMIDENKKKIESQFGGMYKNINTNYKESLKYQQQSAKYQQLNIEYQNNTNQLKQLQWQQNQLFVDSNCKCNPYNQYYHSEVHL
jgi:hypothetical protein